jgi:hypothetical protein
MSTCLASLQMGDSAMGIRHFRRTPTAPADAKRPTRRSAGAAWNPSFRSVFSPGAPEAASNAVGRTHDDARFGRRTAHDERFAVPPALCRSPHRPRCGPVDTPTCRVRQPQIDNPSYRSACRSGAGGPSGGRRGRHADAGILCGSVICENFAKEYGLRSRSQAHGFQTGR